MKNTFVDLYRHQDWADAEIWRAAEAHAAALSDTTWYERQHHIHLVQQAFYALVSGADLAQHRFTRPGDYETPSALTVEARRSHEAWNQFVDRLDAGTLERRVVVPWFREPALEISVAQALTQAAMHSHYHRGQQAARLRELGGTPPLTDYIAWLWKGKPPAAWP
jgi:uncharacterized damage-inducible protein DinB